MKNKEAYKHAFKHVHYQKEINLNQKRIFKPFVTIMTSFMILLSTFTIAYAFDVGNIQNKVELWFHAEKTNVQYKEEEKNVYHFYATDKDGNVVDIGVDMGFKDSPTGIQSMNGEELAKSMNEEAEIVYDEKDGKYLFYYQDKAVDITKMFDQGKKCYLVINNGEKDIYFVISYKDTIDDYTISKYSNESDIKDIKNKFVRIK